MEQPPLPALHRRPLAVWGVGMPESVELSNALRSLALRLHVAGGAAARIGKVDPGAVWLRARYPEQTLPPDGAPVVVALALHPAPLRSGTYRVTVSVPVRFTGGGRQTLQHSLRLTVPQGAVPWFDQAALSFAGEWPLRSVHIQAMDTVALLCGGETESPEAPGHTLRLYPGEYELAGPPGTFAVAKMDDLDLQWRLPTACRVPGPSQLVVLRNLGAERLVGRLATTVPWLRVAPEFIDLPPGQAASAVVECFDDGRHWQERTGSVELRQHRGDTVLASLPVERSLTMRGPQPVLLTTGVRFPPVTPGATAAATVRLRNGGDRPLHIRTSTAGPAPVLAPGEAAAVPVQAGPPYTAQPGFASGELLLSTDGPLPFWRWLRVPFAVTVVAAVLETREIDFGDVPYKQTAQASLRVLRSDHGRSVLKLELPAELTGALHLAGEQLYLRNQQPRPLTIDAEFPVFLADLGGAPLGQLRVRGRCLIPRLELHLPTLRLVPGRSATLAVSLRDAGGGLELYSVQSDQPWATVRRVGIHVDVQVETDRLQRGRLCAQLIFLSNDYAQPHQEHSLVVELTPTRWMRLADWLKALWQPVPALSVRLWRAAWRTLRRAR